MKQKFNQPLIDNEYYLNLEEHIKEVKKFHTEGWQRIKKYYEIQNEEERKNETKLSKPPHHWIKEESKNLVRLSVIEKTGFSIFDYILLGIGTELLLKSIILKEDPQTFIAKSKERKDIIITPSFWECKKIVCEKLLKDVLDEKQHKRLDNVLTLINEKRNELAHLHFHDAGHYAVEYQIFNVLEFLFKHYFAEEKEFTDLLSAQKKKNKVEGGMDFEPIEFEIMKR